jgi:molybdate transport system permease protein
MTGQPLRRRFLLAALLVAAAAVMLVFLTLPIIALFVKAPLRRLPALLTSQPARDAIVVSAQTNLLADVVILLVGTPTAYLIARHRFPGRLLVLTLIELPLVLPPAVAGIALLVAFGAPGLLGGFFAQHGISLAFTQAAVVVAVVFVASPFYIRAAVAAFEAVDPRLLAAARTLGSGPVGAFFRVALPLASGGLGAGFALAFARGIGEFGATLFFAGNIQGVSQTLPLAVYDNLNGNFDVALALGVVLVGLSALVLLSYKLIAQWTRSASTSITASAPPRSASTST